MSARNLAQGRWARPWARILAVVTITVLAAGPIAAAQHGETGGDASPFDSQMALKRSQAAIGRQVSDHAFLDTKRREVRLADYRGRPLVVNLVYTACEHTCPMIVQSLARTVDVARGALGADAFSVVTIGFDTRNDTPERMRAYAREQGVDVANWDFLSGDKATVKALAEELGFLYKPTGRGFDHLAQVSILDAEGKVYRQVYGGGFEAPALVEPLKSLALGRSLEAGNVSGLVERVRLFCTFYDPKTGRYRFDYSIVFALGVGGVTLAGLGTILVRVWVRERRGSSAT